MKDLKMEFNLYRITALSTSFDAKCITVPTISWRVCRPFVWRNEVYLGHWIAYMPGEERMAISRLDREEGAVKLVHRFTSLSDEVEAAVLPDLTPGQGSLRKAGVLRLTSGKLSEQGSKFRYCYMAHMWCKRL